MLPEVKVYIEYKPFMYLWKCFVWFM